MVRVLVVGASYGLLPAAKIAAAGHPVTVIGRAEEAAAIEEGGIEIRFGEGRSLVPPMGREGIRLRTPKVAEPAGHDLAILAVQEPQASAAEIRDLLSAVGSHVPIASIMNMPPPPFLDRVEPLRGLSREGAYVSVPTWNSLRGSRMTLAGPDPQVYRPEPSRPGRLQVTLASNFKFAPFAREADQAILARVARDASRVRVSWGKVPVNLLARTSLFVPMAKWPMLVTGNCRCVLAGDASPLTIRDAVRRNIDESRFLYQAVNMALEAVGAPGSLLVPFSSYATAAEQLSRPSSLALALDRGVTDVERIDMLVLNLLKLANADGAAIEVMVGVRDCIDDRLKRNRSNTGKSG